MPRKANSDGAPETPEVTIEDGKEPVDRKPAPAEPVNRTELPHGAVVEDF